MRIGILEAGEVSPELREAHGDYPAMFATLLRRVDPSIALATVRVAAGETPAGPSQADAWLVTGSRHGVYDGLDWIDPLKAFLRDCVAAGVPVVGVCFGHQVLAEALGGAATKSERGWGLGVQDYEVVARPGWLGDLPRRFALRALHQDQVVRLPADATVLARSAHCPYAALAYGDPERPAAISLQPHPEFSAAFLEALIDRRAGVAFAQEAAAEAGASLGRAVEDDAWARVILDFLRRALAERPAAQSAGSLAGA